MKIIIGLIIIFAVVLQTTLVSYVAILRVKPDLLLMIVLYIGFKRGPLSGEISGFLSGFLEDIFSGNLIGINALSKTILGNLAGLGKDKLAFENLITQVVVTFLATSIYTFLVFLLKTFFLSQGISFVATIKYGVVASFYNAIISIFVFRLLDKLKIGA